MDKRGTYKKFTVNEMGNVKIHTVRVVCTILHSTFYSKFIQSFHTSLIKCVWLQLKLNSNYTRTRNCSNSFLAFFYRLFFVLLTNRLLFWI